MAMGMTRAERRAMERKEKKDDIIEGESDGEERIPLSAGGLYLVNQATVSVQIHRVDPSSKSIDEWTLKETLRNLISREASLTGHQFQLTTMEKSAGNSSLSYSQSVSSRGNKKSAGMEKFGGKIRGDGVSSTKKRDREETRGSTGLVRKLAGRSVMARFLVRVVCTNAETAGAKVVDKLNGLELSLGGMRLVCDAQSEDVALEEMRKEWEAKYGPSETGYRSRRQGERPDTLVIRGLPCRWLVEPRVSSKPSVLVTHTIFSSFGTIRNLEFLNSEEPAQGSGPSSSDFGAVPFMTGLECGVIIQYEDHATFCKALAAMCGRAMKKSGSSLCVYYKVHWDSDEYFSEKSVRRRKFEKDRLEEMERRKAAEEKRRAAIEDRKAELRRLEEEKKEEEEKERLKREEAERKQREEEAARVAEEKRREEEERLRREEEERRVEEERKQREEAAKEEERKKREEERLEREKKEQEAWRLLKEKERKEREEEKARRHEEEMRERERAARKREEEEKERRRLLAERDLRRLDEKRQLLEEELGRRDTEKRLRARVAERMAERAAALKREAMRRRDERMQSKSSSSDEEDEEEQDEEEEEAIADLTREHKAVEKSNHQPGRTARSQSRSPSRSPDADQRRVQMVDEDDDKSKRQLAGSPSLSTSSSASEESDEASDEASENSLSSDDSLERQLEEEDTYEQPQKRLRSIIVCSPMSSSP